MLQLCEDCSANTEDRCLYDLRYASDAIFMIDRSNSVDWVEFGTVRDFVLKLIKKSMLIGPEPSRVHVAVITFDHGAEVVLDLISEGAPCVYLCELTAPGGQFDINVVYYDESNPEKETNAVESGKYKLKKIS